MVTPTRKQIIAKAQQLYFSSCCGETPNIPEVSELREENWLNVARSELMTEKAKDHEEAWKAYSESVSGFEFNAEEGMATTTFISGSRGTGKSDVAMNIADRLSNDSVICVFDSSLDWIRRSSISQYVTVKPYSVLEVPNGNTIFDVSELTPLGQQRTVEAFSRVLFEYQLHSSKRYYVVLEECQLFFPLNSLRSKKTQNSMRLLTVGRNVNVSMCAISQFPSLIDKELVKNAQQIYIGCTAEPNTLAYWRGLLGEKTQELKNLRNGEFLYYHRNHIRKIQIRPCQSHATKKRIISESEPIAVTIQTQSSHSGIAKLIVVGFGILLLALALSQVI